MKNAIENMLVPVLFMVLISMPGRHDQERVIDYIIINMKCDCHVALMEPS